MFALTFAILFAIVHSADHAVLSEKSQPSFTGLPDFVPYPLLLTGTLQSRAVSFNLVIAISSDGSGSYSQWPSTAITSCYCIASVVQTLLLNANRPNSYSEYIGSVDQASDGATNGFPHRCSNRNFAFSINNYFSPCSWVYKEYDNGNSKNPYMIGNLTNRLCV